MLSPPRRGDRRFPPVGRHLSGSFPRCAWSATDL